MQNSGDYRQGVHKCLEQPGNFALTKEPLSRAPGGVSRGPELQYRENLHVRICGSFITTANKACH